MKLHNNRYWMQSRGFGTKMKFYVRVNHLYVLLFIIYNIIILFMVEFGRFDRDVDIMVTDHKMLLGLVVNVYSVYVVAYYRYIRRNVVVVSV